MMTADEVLDIANDLQSKADAMRKDLDGLQPRTTREQWSAYDCLRSSALHMFSAAVWLARQEEKEKPDAFTK